CGAPDAGQPAARLSVHQLQLEEAEGESCQSDREGEVCWFLTVKNHLIGADQISLDHAPFWDPKPGTPESVSLVPIQPKRLRIMRELPILPDRIKLVALAVIDVCVLLA